MHYVRGCRAPQHRRRPGPPPGAAGDPELIAKAKRIVLPAGQRPQHSLAPPGTQPGCKSAFPGSCRSDHALCPLVRDHAPARGLIYRL